MTQWEQMQPGRKVWEAVGGASILGLLCGLALGATSWLYIAGVAAAVIGGVLAGAQHRRLTHAAARGLAGGTTFGLTVLLGFHLGGAGDPAIALPDPEIFYVALAALPSSAFHVLGYRVAAVRRKTSARPRPVP